ncbi:hypothetical protein [Solilutibacter silvestris]|uniref:hypothetical protein n=1 Tax=Solilutibacter silvestris TaxID=1645665 RepID=UPI003D3259B0
MSLDRTSGFDMLVQISEAEINDQLETLFLAGGVVSPSLSVPFMGGGASGTANLNFGIPIADLDRPSPRMGLRLPFLNSELVLTAPLPLTIAPLGGTIDIEQPIVMLASGGAQTAALDFATTSPDVHVTFDAASAAALAPLLAAAGMNLAQASNFMAGVVRDQLRTSIRQINLTPAIPVTDGEDPIVVADISVGTVNDTSAADQDCLSFGVRMGGGSAGNIGGITTSMIPAGQQSLVMMSNGWLLGRIMRPRVASSLGQPLSAFDLPMHLNRNVPAPGGHGTLTNLDAVVEGNRIKITGRAVDSGTGWDAECKFTFFITLGISGGSITVTASTPQTETDVDLAWWVWLVSLGLGALFGGITGAIIAAVVLAVVQAVAEGIVSGLVSGGISGSIGSIPSIPLGPIGGGLSLTNVVLDDLELRSSIVRSVSVPIKSQGTRVASGPFAIDLDTGVVSATASSKSDLVWGVDRVLRTHAASGLTITGASYAALTPVQVARMPLSGTQIASGQIPVSFPQNFPFMPLHAVVFGVRTSEGRFAKVRAWIDIFTQALNLEWVTFDTPVASLELVQRWSVIARGEQTSYITDNCEYCVSGPVSRCGVFEAQTRLVPFPAKYAWCVCGHRVEEGQGELDTTNGPLAYRVSGNRLYLETDMGESVDCEVCVSVVDARGTERHACVRAKQDGIDRQCKTCVPGRKHVAIDTLALDPKVAAWRPLLVAMAPEDHEEENIR